MEEWMDREQDYIQLKEMSGQNGIEEEDNVMVACCRERASEDRPVQ